MSHTTKPIIRTTDPDTGAPGPSAHAMEPTPGYLQAMAQLLAIVDRAYNQFWIKHKTPGLFEAKSLFQELMTAYEGVVRAGDWIGKRASGPVTPDPKPSPGPNSQPQTTTPKEGS